MKMEDCRNRLLGIWGIGFGLLFFLLLLQTFFLKYGTKYDEVTGWFFPLTVPTLMLMVGVTLAERRNETKRHAKIGKAKKESGEIEADSKIFKIAQYGSIFYLLLIFSVFFIEPLVPRGPLELMKDTKPFLSVLDGLVTAVIGYFFVKK